MWQLIQDNFISNYHEYLGDLHHMLVALSKIQTFVFSWTPLIYIYVHLQQDLLEAINSCSNVGFSHSWPQSQLCSLFNCWLSADLRVKVQPFVTKLNVWNITRNPSRDSGSRQLNWSSVFPSFGCLMIPRRIIKCQFTNDLNHAHKRHLMMDKKNKVLELEPWQY